MSYSARRTILQVASGDIWAGAEVQMFYLCRQLSRSGANVRVILFNDGILARKLREEGIDVSIFDEKQLSNTQLLKSFIRSIRHVRPDVIHTHGHKENILVGFANLVCGHVPCVQTIHGAREIKFSWWQLRGQSIALLDYLVSRFLYARIVTVSDELGASLSRHFSVDKVRVIENAIDVNHVKALGEAPCELTLPQHVFNIGIVGRLVPLKRHDLILKAAQELAASSSSSSWKLYIIGVGPEKPRIEHMIDTLGLAGRVIMTGAIDPVCPVLKQLDLIVMPSDHEGLPMVLLEAMSLGIPIVCSSVGGIGKLLDQGRCAKFVHQRSGSAYAQAIAEAMNDRAQMKRLANEAERQVMSNYDITSKCREYEELYASIYGGESR